MRYVLFYVALNLWGGTQPNTNLVSDYSATCNGTGPNSGNSTDNTSMNTWAAAALSWQASNIATATATASLNSTTMTVASVSGTIVNGSIVQGLGLLPNTFATISGSTVTLSKPTQLAIPGGTPVTFFPPITLTIGQNGQTLNISNVSISGTTITVTTSTPYSWVSGQWVSFLGLETAGLSGLDLYTQTISSAGQTPFQITVTDSTHFTITATVTGTYTSGGTVSTNTCMFTAGDSGNYGPFTTGGYTRNVTGLHNLTVCSSTSTTNVGSGGQCHAGDGTLSGSPIAFSGGLAGGYTTAGFFTAGVGPAGTWSARTAAAFIGDTQVTILPTAAVTVTLTGTSGTSTLTCSQTCTNFGLLPGSVQTLTCITPGCGVPASSPILTVSGTTVTISGTLTGNVNASILATFTVASECALFPSGRWIAMTGWDMQGSGYSQNPAFYDYVMSLGCNSGTGVVLLNLPLSHNYETTWPLYNVGDTLHADQGGPATAFWLDPSFNTYINFNGFIFGTNVNNPQIEGPALGLVFNSVASTGGNCIIPANAYFWQAINSNLNGCDLEVDKMLGTVDFNNTTLKHMIAQSKSLQLMIFENGSHATQFTGTFETTQCNNSTIDVLAIGVPAYGAGLNFYGNGCSSWEIS